MDVSAAVITLLLIMDPIGNIPPFLSILKTVPVERRRLVLMREILFAYGVLLVFLFLGKYLLRFLRLEQETLSIAGGIVLFLIALRMIFPREGASPASRSKGSRFWCRSRFRCSPVHRRSPRCCCLQRGSRATTRRCSSR